MDITSAQRDMRTSYAGGAPGVLVSGLVWLAAGIVWASMDVEQGFVALFIGGMAIFPVSTLIARTAFRAPKTAADNPLNRLALESTFVLMAGILIGYVLLIRLPEMAIPAVSVVMGARYFIFASVYGRMLFWGLAGAICAFGTLALLGLSPPFWNLAIVIGVVELVFGMALLWLQRVSS